MVDQATDTLFRNFDFPIVNSLEEYLMVAFALVRIRDGKVGNGPVEFVTPAKVTADFCRLAGTGVGASEGPAAQFGVLRHRASVEDFDEDLDLHVPELADVEMAATRASQPAQEEIAGRLHEAAPIHDPLTVVREQALPSIRLQDRGARFFDLQEKCVLFTGKEKRDTAPRADAAHADNLDCDVLEFVTINEYAPIIFERLEIGDKGRLSLLEKFFITLLAPMKDNGRVVFDGRPPPGNLFESGKMMFMGAVVAGCGQSFLKALASLVVLDSWNNVFDVDACIPYVQHWHFAELRHVMPIRANAGHGYVSRNPIAKAVVATGEHKTGGETFDVPLPRCGQGFVEIVDVEDLASFRSGEQTEVEQVAIPASLDAQTSYRRMGEVRGHVESGSSIECERRLQHACVAQRDKFGNASMARLLQ